jgi:hypothetical protein
LNSILLIPVANIGNNYQTADNLKWTWRKKMYLYAYSTSQRCLKEIMQMFLIEDFSICHALVSTTPVVHL